MGKLCWFCDAVVYRAGVCLGCHARGLRVIPRKQRENRWPKQPPKPPHTPHHKR